MHQPLYRQALKKSWDLAWNHKFLWIFGLFAAFLGQMGLLELLTKVGMASSAYALYPAWLGAPSLLWDGSISLLATLPSEQWAWFFCLVLIFLAIGLFLVFVSVASQGALIRAAAQSTKKKNLPSISDAWGSGVKHFWRLFFINLIKKAILVIMAVFVGYATWNAVLSPSVFDVILFLLVFILAVLVGLAASFLSLYAGGYVVVEEFTLLKSLESAWKLFTSHWLVSLEVASIVLFLDVFLGLVVLVGILLVIMPLTFLSYFAILIHGGAWLLVINMIGVFLLLLFIMFLGALFTIFVTTAWTYLFMKMHSEGIKSKIIHTLTWKKGE